ncbi:hypothetical protein HYQ45_005188 [Verticillium longisporum]|uniref:Uncharacterized protein n=3 Tax=Verticillium TaxID=1036719 RepID=G2WRW1_VERDV|nr:uncharacterized protein VDAG_00294 [Verticillium dahliae VdLs.17]KAF3344325.1 hypothetical protein VdG2_07424 [Verticillium dahliae VDG2]KAG7137524.1 hypothetical protein HYQ45_005188 [Verticillium longisporum]KAH6710065.1 hypothetical protein EV126DRAFT_13043 [Verticillium dahliae]EGY13612.1 hypothetical protein VDAG_00294 [Verticillium dahliae VdLs.17]PNH34132.1 hypothetical protein BJF96_g2564 [Verticillium dahliae]
MATTSSNLLVTTPRPTAAPNTRIHTGRGGAGNTFRAAPSKTSSSSPVSGSAAASASAPAAASSAGPSTARTAGPSSSTRRFYSGIGGAGNVHAAGERPAVSFEEEIARARAREKSGVGRVGIGGAGNIFRRKKKEEEQQQGHGDQASRIEGERKGSLWSLGSWESVIKEQKA